MRIPLVYLILLISWRKSVTLALPQNPYEFSGSSPLIPPRNSPTDSFGDIHDRETFEDHAAAWRQYQQEQQQQRNAADAASPIDETGKMKLIASVSNASICFFFFVLMWRAVHHYELADAYYNGGKRLLMVTPPVLLFVGNMAGCVSSITSQQSSGKNRLKAILNLNKLLEAFLFFYNIMRLTIAPSKYVPREIYVGRTLTNFMFLIQCQLFTKVAWNAAKRMPASPLDQSTQVDQSSEVEYQDAYHREQGQQVYEKNPYYDQGR